MLHINAYCDRYLQLSTKSDKLCQKFYKVYYDDNTVGAYVHFSATPKNQNKATSKPQ